MVCCIPNEEFGNPNNEKILPFNGIEFRVLKRKEQEGEPISASRVRKLLTEKRFEDIKKLVPETTFEYLKNKYFN